jgi:predicted lipoprotein
MGAEAMSPPHIAPNLPAAVQTWTVRRWRWVALIVAIIIFLVVDPQWTTQKIQPPGAGSTVAASVSLDPTDYVNKNWASKILPAAHKSAIDLPTLLADLKRDPKATVNRHGHTATLGGQPTFLVKGTAHVVSVNTSGIPAYAVLALGSSHKAAVHLQLGPILTGTDVRDAMRFISFNQFADQVTYGEVATAINRKIESTSLASVDNKKLAGKTIRFYGAFTYQPGQLQLITPIILKEAR